MGRKILSITVEALKLCLQNAMDEKRLKKQAALIARMNGAAK